MLTGITAEEKKTLKLGDAKEYKFLTKVFQYLSAAHCACCTHTFNNPNPPSHVLQGDCFTCVSRDEAKDYSRIHSAMKILTFSKNQCEEIHKLLAAILHLGNVCFEGEHTLCVHFKFLVLFIYRWWSSIHVNTVKVQEPQNWYWVLRYISTS